MISGSFRGDHHPRFHEVPDLRWQPGSPLHRYVRLCIRRGTHAFSILRRSLTFFVPGRMGTPPRVFQRVFRSGMRGCQAKAARPAARRRGLGSYMRPRRNGQETLLHSGSVPRLADDSPRKMAAMGVFFLGRPHKGVGRVGDSGSTVCLNGVARKIPIPGFSRQVL